MTYASEYDSLAKALAELVARSPDEWAVDRISAHTAFAARDVIATRLTAMAAAVVNAPAHPQQDFPVRFVVVDPGHALHAALADLPRARTDHRRGADVLFGGPRNEPGPWQRATRACVYLEPYAEALRRLDGPTAWTTLRGIANLSRNLLLLDEDLTVHHGARHVDQGRGGALRIAAEELCIRVPLQPDQPRIALPPPARPIRVGSIGDLPGAMQRLAAMLDARGGELAAVEVRAAARVLEEGFAVTARAFADQGGADELVTVLALAVRDAQRLGGTPMATLTSPSAPIQYLAGAIVTQLRAASGILDRLDASPGSRCSDRRAVADALLPWAGQAAGVGAAVERGLRASDQRGLLLAPTPASSSSTYRWTPAAAPERRDEPAAIAAAGAVGRSSVRIARTVTTRPEAAVASPSVVPAADSVARPTAVRGSQRHSLAQHPAQRIG